MKQDRPEKTNPKTEAALHTIEMHRMLFEEASDGIFIADGRGRYIEVNERACKMLGYSRKRLLSMSIRDLVPAEDLQTAPLRLKELQDGKSVISERRLKRKDGSLLIVEINARMLSDGSMLGITRDISRRKRIEQEVEELARFPGENPNPVLRVSRVGRVEYANPASSPLLKEWKCKVGGLLPSHWQTLIKEQVAAKSRKTVDFPCKERVYSIMIVPIEEAGYVNLYARDITERVQSEQLLKQSEEQYRYLFDSHPLPMWIYDLKTLKFLEVNDAAVGKYGYSHAEFMKMTLADIRPVEDVERLMEDIKKPRPDLQHSGDWRHKLKDGRVIDVEITSHTINLPDREAVLVVAQDVTARKLAEKKVNNLSRLYATLSQVNQTIVHVKSEEILFHEICNVAVVYGHFKMAWIGLWDEENDLIDPVTFAGSEGSYLKEIKIQIQKGPFSKGPSGTAVRENRVVISEDIATDRTMRPWREEAIQRGFASSAAVPLCRGGIVVGVFNLYASTPGFFIAEEIQLLEEISQDISFALDNIEAEKQRRQADDALRESEQRYRLLFDEMISGYAVHEIICDQTGEPVDYRFLSVNAAFEKMTGLNSIEILGKTVLEVMPATEPIWIEQYGQVALTREPAQFENYASALGRYYEVRAFSPEPGKFATIFNDITERKQAEEALRESEERLRLSLQAANQGLYDLNVQTGNAIVNREYAEMLGYDPDTFVETNAAWIERLHPDDQAVTSKVYLDYTQGLTPEYRVEFRQRTKDGNWKWILSLGKVIEYDKIGKPLRMLGTHTDITARRQAEEKLIVSEVRYRRLFEAARDGILILDAETGVIVDVNPFLIEMLGYSQEEIRGKELWELGFFKDIAANKANFLELQQKEYIRYEDLPLETAYGRRFRVEFVSNVYQVDHHKVVQCNIRDITDRKQAEDEVHRLNEELEQRVIDRTEKLAAANKELEAFSYSVSHDLRAPLRAIDGYTRILLEDHAPTLDEEGKRVCSVITNEAHRMGELIDDLLAFSRLSRAEMHSMVIDMKAMVKTVFDDLTRHESGERIDFHMGNLPSALGDAMLIRQVWVNLITNALKFTSRKERAVIEVSGTESEDEVIYSIRDNGAGFDMKYSGKLFGVFQRLHSESEFEGTGVGLAIVQNAINRHGGRVWAEGETGRGAAFFFALPKKHGKK